jgi:molybdopterin-guanine dinucleotide biosynthesis protein A
MRANSSSVVDVVESISSSAGGTPDARASASRAAASQASIAGDYHDVTGVVLLGGASSRFGSQKALAVLNGVTLAERAWNILGEAFGQRLAIGKANDKLQLPFEVLDDGSDVRAPMAGVVGGLKAATTDVCVFLPVDMPLVDATTLRALADNCSDAAVPPSGPLPGAYRRSALPLLTARLAAGELALYRALTALDAKVVPIASDVLANINTAEDLAAIRR